MCPLVSSSEDSKYEKSKGKGCKFECEGGCWTDERPIGAQAVYGDGVGNDYQNSKLGDLGTCKFSIPKLRRRVNIEFRSLVILLINLDQKLQDNLFL